MIHFLRFLLFFYDFNYYIKSINTREGEFNVNKQTVYTTTGKKIRDNCDEDYLWTLNTCLLFTMEIIFGIKSGKATRNYQNCLNAIIDRFEVK